MSFLPRRAAAGLAFLVAASAYGQECSTPLFRDGFEQLAQNRYEVELVVTGLGSRSASFQLNGGEIITATGDGSICFAEPVQGGQAYEVAITEQPATGDVCGGELSGTASGPISIAISCALERTEWNQFNWDEANWN